MKRGTANVSRVLLSSAVLALFLSSLASAQAPPPTPTSVQTRMKLQDFVAGPDGAKRLASLKKAVAKMKSLDNSAPDSVEYRRSWAYWANIHGYYGPDSPEGTVAEQRTNLAAYLKQAGRSQAYINEALAFYDGMSDQSLPPARPDSPAYEIALAVWDTCQHSDADGNSTSDNIGLNQANFFGWHRMYLYYFERVLRWAAQDETLTLPYWDYTDPAQEELPDEFRDTASSLFDKRRDADMNSGSQQLSSLRTNVDQLLTNPNYLAYEFKIERGIHGYVHCTVGLTCPVAHMGDVPVAANDPIFYTHHANIDRLWSCWQKLHPMPTNTLWLMQQFMFPDETGALQKQPVSNFVNTQLLGYQYDNESSCFRVPPAPLRVEANLKQEPAAPVAYPNLVASSPGVALKPTTTSIDIVIPRVKATSLLAIPEGTSKGVQLVLRHVIAEQPPLSLLDVYIERKGAPSTRQYVGTINWFGAFRHHGMKMASDQSYDFEVTQQLKALGLTPTSPNITITLEASDGRVPTARAKAAVRATPPAATLSEGAKVRVGAVELRQTK
jgi:hypothetical protein